MFDKKEKRKSKFLKRNVFLKCFKQKYLLQIDYLQIILKRELFPNFFNLQKPS